MCEEKLEANQKILQEYKKVVDAGAIVSKTDTKGNITYVNEQFCAISGYTPQELLGKNHNIVRHPDVKKSIYEDLWKSITNKQTWKGKIKNRAKDGSAYYVSVVIVPILDENENVVEYLALRQDITELEVLNNFLEERVAQEVQKNKEQDELRIATLTAFLENSPNPIVVYRGVEVLYANSKFLKLTKQTKEQIIASNFDIDSLFTKRVGCITSVSQIDPQSKSNKVSLLLEKGRNIFNLFVSDIPFSDNSLSKMYTFNNITLQEYQKLKITHYSEQLEEFIRKIRKSSPQIEPKKEEISQADSSPQQLDAAPKIKRVLSTQERNVLKKTRENVAVSSQEYSQEIDSYALEKSEELGEIEEEMSERLREFSEEKNLPALFKISEQLSRYAANVSFLIEFEDLSYAINTLSGLLEAFKIEEIDEAKYKKIKLYLSNILHDLSNWRYNIFVEQTANDIHYLDSSLFSTILQFELAFNQADVIEDEDDFEMF